MHLTKREKLVGSRMDQITNPIKKSWKIACEVSTSTSHRAGGGGSTYANELVQEHATEVAARPDVEGEDASRAVGREHDRFELSGSFESLRYLLLPVSQ